MSGRNKLEPPYINLLSPDKSYVHHEEAPAAPRAKVIENDDKNTVKTSNCWRSTRQSSEGGTQHKIVYVCNTDTDKKRKEKKRKGHSRQRSKQHVGILDSDTTGHFCIPGVDVENIQQAVVPLIILQPNGETLHSTHTCDLKIPWLPAEMRRAHIVPGLAHTTLISIRQFCKAGATVLFDGNTCYVFHIGRILLK